MVTEDQTEVVSFLSSPAAHGGADVERLETHASLVFLGGGRALKLKRAVRYDYLDFSTSSQRRRMCEAELRLNRRTAPRIYRAIVPITREEDGRLALAGRGDVVDWVLSMRRFDQADLLDRMAARGDLDLDLMPPLARAIAHLHAIALQRTDHGGAAGMRWVVEGNARGFAEQGAGMLDPEACAQLTTDSLACIARLASRLDARRDRGLVRVCHGDLHLRNIVLLDGVPTLFDGIEFNDELSCIDVLYDLAFLLMDLWRRGLTRHANVLWNAYLLETNDVDGLPLLPLFLSCRAAIRAKTSATAASLQPDATRRQALEELAREYLALATRFLRPPAPRLIAIGGRSGTGKSTLAQALAPAAGAAPGAVVVRSDEIRKQLHGVAASARLGPEAYTPDESRRVYDTLCARAAAVVEAGQTVIADAVFGRPEDRDALAAAARRAGVALVGMWLDAPGDLLIDRVGSRHGDASDADAAVVAVQLTQDTGPITWHRLDASASAQTLLARALALVRDQPSQPDRVSSSAAG